MERIHIGTRELYGATRKRQFSPLHLNPSQHTYLIGRTGMGKTTFLEHLSRQHIANGAGLALLDPHGDLAERLLAHIPAKRIPDVCYFHPHDRDWPIAWNLLAGVPPDEQPLITEAIVDSFQTLFGASWGPRTEHICRNAARTLIATPNTSLLSMQKLLTDDDYRSRILAHVKDPAIRSFWQHEYEQWDPRFRREAIAPLQNKLGQLFGHDAIRLILGQVKNKLHLRRIMDHRGLFIANLSGIGTTPAKLLGSLLFSHLQHAASQRIDTPPRERIPFFCHVDEFQRFVTATPENFEAALAESRKYKLFLTLAHQHTAQLAHTALLAAVIANAGNIISFRIGATDARLMEDVFAPDIPLPRFLNLPQRTVIAKLADDPMPGVPTEATIVTPSETPEGHRDAIIAESRRTYAQPRAKVETTINKFLAA